MLFMNLSHIYEDKQKYYEKRLKRCELWQRSSFSRPIPFVYFSILISLMVLMTHTHTHRNHIILVFLVRICCCSSYQQNFLILKLLNMYVTAFHNIYNLREISHCEFHLVLTNCSINFYLKARERKKCSHRKIEM